MAKHNGLVVVWQETESKIYRPFAFRFNKAPANAVKYPKKKPIVKMLYEAFFK